MDQILSVCTGIGGLDLGLHAGLRSVGREARTVCMVEREAFACAVLGKAIEEGRLDDAPLWLGDLRELPLDELPAIDWYTGGYPCQPWSQAGKRLGEDDPRHLWPIILEQLKSLRPRGVFFENVGGHLSLGLDRVLQDLAGCGFRCAFGLFTAEEVGAPHRRERVFILGLADTRLHDETPRRKREAASEGSGSGDGQSGSGCDAREGYREAARETQGLAHGDGGGQPFIGKAHDEDGGLACGDDADRCCEDVADAQGIDGRSGPSTQIGAEPSEGGSVADRHGEGLQGKLSEPIQKRRKAEESSARCGEHRGGWPARPGEDQQDWEPPRTVPSVGRNSDGVSDGMDGRASTNRTDRLRALGNGVVPMQAAEAFINLYKELEA